MYVSTQHVVVNRDALHLLFPNLSGAGFGWICKSECGLSWSWSQICNYAKISEVKKCETLTSIRRDVTTNKHNAHISQTSQTAELSTRSYVSFTVISHEACFIYCYSFLT